jgi:hypothetical protein
MTPEQKKPVYFSDYFKVDKAKLDKLGVFDPILNYDTKVFVEPLLLEKSSNQIIRDSFTTYQKFFSNLLLLLQKAEQANSLDRCWRTAKKMVNFPEYNYTCIGYSSYSTDGRGSGTEFNDKILQSAKEIIDLAENNPDIFLLLPLLEDGIAGDRISDMVQNIIDDDICKYTAYVTQKLGIEGNINHNTKNLNRYSLLKNPYSKSPIKLIPRDILLSLPVADYVDSFIEEVATDNENLRVIINKSIGDIWHKTNKSYRKEVLLREVKTNKSFFIETVQALREASLEHYDLDQDYQGLYKWLKNSEQFINFELSKEIRECTDDIEALSFAVRAIIHHFKDMIENKEIWKTFWAKCDDSYKHVREYYSQMLFFTVANTWLTSQNSNINVDVINHHQPTVGFTISGKNNITVHIKHGNNGYLASMYNKLLDKYRKHHQNNNFAFYLVMSFYEDKSKQLQEVENIQNPLCELFVIDVTHKTTKPKSNNNEPLLDVDWNIEIDFGISDNSEWLSFDGYELEDINRFKRDRKKGAKTKHKKTDNIKYHVIKHMFINKRQENRKRKVSEIANAIIYELNNLQNHNIKDFAKKYSINKIDYVAQALEYLESKQDGGQIPEWCYQVSQGKL